MAAADVIERHPHARAVLEPALPPAGTPSHAYLFHGPAGAGKRAAARAVAAALLADGAPDPDGAAERARRGTHPDLTWVRSSGAAEMLVSDVDEAVVAAAARTPLESRRRVFVIDGADALNDQAANRLLKTLEEPAPFAHLILIADRPDAILPTIVSRCQQVRFDAPPPREIAQRLADEHDVVPAQADACARLALGDAALALQIARSPQLRAASQALARADAAAVKELLTAATQAGARAAEAEQESLRRTLELLPSGERRRAERESAERERRADRRARQGALDLALRLAGLWLRDAACVADGCPELVHNSDLLDELRRDGRDPDALRAGVQLIDDTRARLARNVGEELALEALVYRLASGPSRGSSP